MQTDSQPVRSEPAPINVESARGPTDRPRRISVTFSLTYGADRARAYLCTATATTVSPSTHETTLPSRPTRDRDLPGSSSGHARRGGCARHLRRQRQGARGDPAAPATERPDQGEDHEGRRRLRRRSPRQEQRPRRRPAGPRRCRRQVNIELQVQAKATAGYCAATQALILVRAAEAIQGPKLLV
jgi:hypothetical protein